MWLRDVCVCAVSCLLVSLQLSIGVCVVARMCLLILFVFANEFVVVVVVVPFGLILCFDNSISSLFLLFRRSLALSICLSVSFQSI